MSWLLRLLATGAAGAPGSGSRVRAVKRRLVRPVTNRLVNPLVRGLVERGLLEPGWALLETRGRRSGRPRVVPVGNGLRHGVFWIVTEHGYHADYVRNILADPRVRVRAGGRWRSGRARVLPHDDPYARLRALRRPLNDALLLAVGTEQLVIRIDLDDATGTARLHLGQRGQTADMSDPVDPRMAPGDEAPSERDEVAPNVCPDCGGSGRRGGRECSTCGGSGQVEEAVGGG